MQSRCTRSPADSICNTFGIRARYFQLHFLAKPKSGIQSKSCSSIIRVIANDTLLVHVAQTCKNGTIVVTTAHADIIFPKVSILKDLIKVLIVETRSGIFLLDGVIEVTRLIYKILARCI